MIYEVTGSDPGLKSAITSAPNGSRVVLVGLHEHPREIDVRRVTLGEIDLLGTNAHVCDVDLPEAVRVLATRPGGWADIAPTAFPLELAARGGDPAARRAAGIPHQDADRPVGRGAARRGHGGDRALVDGPRVGFLGLGRMGDGDGAARRRAPGSWPRSGTARRGPAEALADELGVEACANPADVARASDVVVTMVSDGAAVDAVAQRPDGLVAGLRPGAVWAEMSTIGRAPVTCAGASSSRRAARPSSTPRCPAASRPPRPGR